MSYQIISESVKSAVSIKLGEIFNNPYRYKENITKPKYPNFQIIQVQLVNDRNGLTGQSAINNFYKNRIQLDYLLNIQYRVAENTETITNLQEQLDEVGFKLNTEFNTIDLELPVKIKDKNYEKVDGVGQFTCNVTVYGVPQETKDEVMAQLDESVDLG